MLSIKWVADRDVAEKHGTPVRGWPGRVGARPTVLRNQTEAMSIKTSTGLENSGTAAETDDEPSIKGPIPEFDRFGDYTGHEYFRCTGCGVEAMRRRDLRDGGCKCNGGWS